MTRLLLPVVLLLSLLSAAAPASAGSSISFGISVGSGGHHHGYRGHRYDRHRYYGHHRPYYRPYVRHRHYYGPPAVVYVAPRPVYVRPAPPPPVACREYRGDATIDGSGGRPFYGRACLLGDGQWHIVRRD